METAITISRVNILFYFSVGLVYWIFIDDITSGGKAETNIIESISSTSAINELRTYRWYLGYAR